MEPYEYFKKQYQLFAIQIPSNDASVQKKAQTVALLF